METECVKRGLRFLPLKTRLKDGYYIEGHFVPPKNKTTITGVFFENENIHVKLSDGRTVITPLSWFPVLEQAAPEKRIQYKIGPRSIHWEELDEDLPLDIFLDQY